MSDNQLTFLYEELAQTDRLLLEINRVLFRTQPTAKGKINLAFYKLKGGDEIAEPFILRFRGLTANGKKKYPEKLPEKNLN